MLTRNRTGWQAHEAYVQNLLNLDSTPASGSQFNAPGDAVDHRHPTDSRFPIMADCKCTAKHSFTLHNHFLVQQTDRAIELGRRFVMPIRFEHAGEHHDYAVIGLDDLAELVDLALNRRCSGCA